MNSEKFVYGILIAMIIAGSMSGYMLGKNSVIEDFRGDGWVRYDKVFDEIAQDIEQCFQPEDVEDEYLTFFRLKKQIDNLFYEYGVCTEERVVVERDLTTCMRDLTKTEREAKMYLGTYSDIQYDAVNAENKLLFCRDALERLGERLTPPEGGYCYLRTMMDECSPLCAPGSCPP